MNTYWNPKARPYKVGKNRRIADYEAVRSRYIAGETCQEIADSLGVSRNRINQITSDVSRPGARLPVERWKVESQKKAIIKAIRSGKSAPEVCRLMGLSCSALYRLVKCREIRPPKSTMHGELSSYRNGGCRCEKCCKANTDYCRKMRYERNNQQ